MCRQLFATEHRLQDLCLWIWFLHNTGISVRNVDGNHQLQLTWLLANLLVSVRLDNVASSSGKHHSVDFNVLET